MLDLERNGIPVAMHDNPDDRLRFGAHRILGDQPIRAEVRVVVEGDIEKVAANACTQEIAYWSYSSRRARARAQAAVNRIEQSIANGTLGPREGFRRVATLSPDLSAAAIFLVASDGSGPSGQPGTPGREGC